MKFQWKEEKTVTSQRRNPQVATVNGDSSFGVQQVRVRINSLHKLRSELEVLEKRIITLLRNSKSTHVLTYLLFSLNF
ncbi:hypothetical protein ACS0TY_027275 [Phlomoides rotata]